MLNNLSKQLIFIFMILFSINSYADGLPPLTHKLTAINKTIKAPKLQLKNLDGDVIKLTAFKGKVVVVNFWATWCPPCRREMGSLERLHQATKNKNVEIVAVNIGEDLDTVFSFLGTVEPSPYFQMLLDTDASSMKTWNVNGLPTTYIIDKKGNIAYRAIGGREFDHPNIIKTILDLAK